MIKLTKRNHEKFLVNHLQIECIEMIPESKIVMMNRDYFIVRETPEEIVAKIAEYTAKVKDVLKSRFPTRVKPWGLERKGPLWGTCDRS